jgi:predicted hydrocarbon binding protein
LIRESLFWATGQNFDVEETSCKAMGKETCEFKIMAAR